MHLISFIFRRTKVILCSRIEIFIVPLIQSFKKQIRRHNVFLAKCILDVSLHLRLFDFIFCVQNRTNHGVHVGLEKEGNGIAAFSGLVDHSMQSGFESSTGPKVHIFAQVDDQKAFFWFRALDWSPNTLGWVGEFIHRLKKM